MEELTLRKELPEDFRTLENLVREAFWDAYRPGCSEHLVLHRLRSAGCYVAELSRVAECGGELIGGIFYSRGTLLLSDGDSLPVLSFGPLAVAAAYRRHGIGGDLVRHTLALARLSGYPAVIIYGNPGYYCRFGFEAAEQYGIATRDGDFCPALLVNWLEPAAATGGRFIEDGVFHCEAAAVAAFDREFPTKTMHVLPGQLTSEAAF